MSRTFCLSTVSGMSFQKLHHDAHEPCGPMTFFAVVHASSESAQVRNSWGTIPKIQKNRKKM